MDFPKQFDNINQRVIDDLKVTLKRGSKVAMAAASFSIYAFEALQKELEKVDELRFILLLQPLTRSERKSKNANFTFQNLVVSGHFTVPTSRYGYVIT